MSDLNQSNPIISHSVSLDLTMSIDGVCERIRKRSSLVLPLDETLKLAQQLWSFPLGAFLIHNRGLNGFWTTNLILQTQDGASQIPLEAWIRLQAPIVKATRERYWIFVLEIQKFLKEGMTLASIPCGMMSDVFEAQKHNPMDIRSVGIDFDAPMMEAARQNAGRKIPHDKLTFIKKDAWNLRIYDQYDLLVSNGLNIYESDRNRLKKLYGNFYKALKKGGMLLTSFLTPPLGHPDCISCNYDEADLRLQTAIFSDIVEAKWSAFMTESEMKALLESVGFEVIDVIYDSQKMFPSIKAIKN
jgi:ubiquinone/menaquinone biosynthesis C-methylase UbiE